MVEVRKVLLSCSYLYEAISCFEARIFDKVCQLQSQLMPQSVDTKHSVCYSHSSSQQHCTSLQLSARKLHDEGKQMLQMDSDGWWVSGDDLIS